MGLGPGEYTVALMHNQRGGSYEGTIPGGRGIEGVGGPHTGGLGRTILGAVWRRAGALVAPVEQEQGRHRPVPQRTGRSGFRRRRLRCLAARRACHRIRRSDPRARLRRFQAAHVADPGQTTLDALRVIDCALAELGTGPEVAAGDVSGGLQAAGCDWGRTSLAR
jgi:hypothetical protein